MALLPVFSEGRQPARLLATRAQAPPVSMREPAPLVSTRFDACAARTRCLQQMLRRAAVPLKPHKLVGAVAYDAAKGPAELRSRETSRGGSRFVSQAPNKPRLIHDEYATMAVNLREVWQTCPNECVSLRRSPARPAHPLLMRNSAPPVILLQSTFSVRLGRRMARTVRNAKIDCRSGNGRSRIGQ